MRLSDFDYELPEELIAQAPRERRDESRLILLDRVHGEVRETRFSNFPRYLREGDILVLNETRVIPARLFACKSTGARVEVFLVRRLGDHRWRAMLRPGKRLRAGSTVYVGEKRYPIRIEERIDDIEWIVLLPGEIPEMRFLTLYGHVPLPPYIKREDRPGDRERYQTVYARIDGSVAAPTAGLHFTEEVLRLIKQKGVTVLPLVLHVGPGTFRPLDNEKVEANRIGSERFIITEQNWNEIELAKREGRRVVAVGTTTTRTLESLASGEVGRRRRTGQGETAVIEGEAGLFIYPGYRFRIVDAIVTNMHLPRSSLLVLVSAFAGRERILSAYRWAVDRRFRFYSYGDVMFIR